MKKAILPIFLVLILALSISAVSANENVTIDDTLSTTDESAAVAENSEDNVIAEDSAPKVEADGDDAKAIQKIIDDANKTAELDGSKTYDVAASNIKINKSITLDGKGATILANPEKSKDETITLSADGITLKNIIFKNIGTTFKYGDPVNGYAVSANGKKGITIENCTFLGFSSGFYGSSVSDSIISDCYFNGSSTSITNDGNKESGTKAINLMGSHYLNITGCIFDGQVLDGISIASGSSDILMKNNTFKNNAYSIYFGGASTIGNIINGNVFYNCGYAYNGTEIKFKNLPVISTQKAANGYAIINNVFHVLDESILIKAESGNTAHGYPSSIGDINITGNTIVTEAILSNKTIFVDILSNSGPLSPYEPIHIYNNTLDNQVRPIRVMINSTEYPSAIDGVGIKSGYVDVWYKIWGNMSDALIPATEKVSSVINIVDVSTTNGTITVQLMDANKGISGKISYRVAGGAEKTVSTDKNGLLTINVDTSGIVNFAYEGDTKYKASNADVNFTLEKELVNEVKNLSTTLKEEKETNNKLTATINEQNTKINQLTNQINNNPTITKQATKLTAAKKTFKRKAKTKKFSATLKTKAGKAIKSKYVEFKIGKTTYIAKTNKKGVATVSVKLTKKGTYTVKVAFSGDSGYNKSSKSAKIVLK